MDAQLATTMDLALARAIHTPTPGVGSSVRAQTVVGAALNTVAKIETPSPRKAPTLEHAETIDAGFIAGTVEMVVWAQARATEIVERPADRDTVRAV